MLKSISRIALPVTIAVVLALAVTGKLLSYSPVVIALQLSAVCLAIWARKTFTRGSFRVVATPAGESLMRRGPYRYVRHPMYSAALLLTWSGIVAHVGIWTVGGGLLVLLVVVVRIFIEEQLLRERYADYADYARHTKALIPFVV